MTSLPRHARAQQFFGETSDYFATNTNEVTYETSFYPSSTDTNSSEESTSMTNTNEVYADPLLSSDGGFSSGPSFDSGGMISGSSLGSFGTFSFGGGGGGLPLDGGIQAQNQATVTITTQTGNLANTFTDGDAGWFNAGSDLGFYAKSTGAKQAAAWQSLTTSGAGNSGTSRSLQVGDEFRITASITRAFGQVGLSLKCLRCHGQQLCESNEQHEALHQHRQLRLVVCRRPFGGHNGELQLQPQRKHLPRLRVSYFYHFGDHG